MRQKLLLALLASAICLAWSDGIIRDKSTKSIQTVDYAHHEIHSGSSYYVEYTVDLANAATDGVLIVTPDSTKWAHMVWEVTNELEMRSTLYEAVTATDDGTALLEVNRNRNSAKTATVVGTYSPTITDYGTTLDNSVVGSGRASGGTVRESNEIILKANTKYLLEVENGTANQNNANIKISWYEHTDKG